MVKAAIIVARDGTGLRPVFGMAAARRLAVAASRLGVRQIHVFARDGSFRDVLSDLVPDHAFHTVAGDVPPGPVGGLSLAEDDRVLVMPAATVIDGWSLKRLVEAADGRDLYCGTGDSSIYVIAASRLEGLLAGLFSSGPGLPDDPPCTGFGVACGLPAALTDDPETTREAEARLVGALGASTAATDSLLSRSVHRPISRFISRRLVKTAVTPNMATIFHIALGLSGGLLLMAGTYASQLAGSLLFLASTILDGVDGELARLKVKESVFGHYLDIVGDNVVHVAVFLGIAVGLFRASRDPAYLVAAAFLLAGFGLCAAAVELYMGHKPGEQASGEPHWIASLLVNRDFAYIVAVMALVNRLSWFLFGTTAGVYAFALILFALRLKRKGRG